MSLNLLGVAHWNQSLACHAVWVLGSIGLLATASYNYIMTAMNDSNRNQIRFLFINLVLAWAFGWFGWWANANIFNLLTPFEETVLDVPVSERSHKKRNILLLGCLFDCAYPSFVLFFYLQGFPVPTMMIVNCCLAGFTLIADCLEWRRTSIYERQFYAYGEADQEPGAEGEAAEIRYEDGTDA